jgi:hypothetical protein
MKSNGDHASIMEDQPVVGKVTDVDLDGILELQAANQIERDGALSASLPRSRVATMLRNMSVIITPRGGLVTGFLLTTTREMNADLPIVQALWAAQKGALDASVSGPICVNAKERGKGKGIAQAMFEQLRALEPGREEI